MSRKVRPGNANLRGISTLSDFPKGFFKDPGHFSAFGFGSGLAPKAPGTVGTLAAVPLYLLIQDWSWGAYVALLVVAFVIGVWICERASKALGVHDHGGIVWDEFVGYWLAMLAAPKGWIWVVLGFVLFRIFDIWKPQPIRWVDARVSGGLGIMLDDVVAGVYALLVMQLLAALV